MKDLLSSLIPREQKRRADEKAADGIGRDDRREQGGESFRKGEVIAGKYEVHGTLGKGGCGVVYLAFDRDTEEWCALKTFRGDLLADASARDVFKREALLWVNLEEHPCILAARWVTEFSGRLFVVMDYVAPDEQRRVSLADHLGCATGAVDMNQALRWAVQFCLGMEHSNAHGIKCHRDIKPANILITQDGTLKIADFGLAVAAEAVWQGQTAAGSPTTSDQAGGFGFSLFLTEGRRGCGTPGYIAPEVYLQAGADVRSDIYSFGLVLWQMGTGSPTPPFNPPWRGSLEAFLRETYEWQMKAKVRPASGLLDHAVERCLQPDPAKRYRDFRELRLELAALFRERTGRTVSIPDIGARSSGFWSNKGGSLANLGHHGEAIGCYDKSLAIDRQQAITWINRGASLDALGRREEAIACYDRALAIEPRNASAWANKANALDALGRHEEAISCLDEALSISPGRANTWYNKGVALGFLGRWEEAVGCFDKALALNPPDPARFWYDKGVALDALGRQEEAVVWYDKTLSMDPRHAMAWNNKGIDLDRLGQYEEAICCYDNALEIDPRDARVCFNRALAQEKAGRFADAIRSYRKFIELAPPQYPQFVARARQRLAQLR